MLTAALRAPYLIFTGDESRRSYAKTGQGIVDWRRELCAGQLRFDGNPLDLGLPDMAPSMAAEAGVGSLIATDCPAWIRCAMAPRRSSPTFDPGPDR